MTANERSSQAARGGETLTNADIQQAIDGLRDLSEYCEPANLDGIRVIEALSDKLKEYEEANRLSRIQEQQLRDRIKELEADNDELKGLLRAMWLESMRQAQEDQSIKELENERVAIAAALYDPAEHGYESGSESDFPIIEVIAGLKQRIKELEAERRCLEASRQSRWIPVEERLPDKGSYVPVSSPLRGEYMTVFTGGWWLDSPGEDDEITHWYDLPPNTASDSEG